MTDIKELFRVIIIKKSSQVFNYYGYKKTTMDDIANAVGKGKSSIYYYFNSKEEIFKAVVEYEADILRIELMNSVNEADQIIDKIRNYVLTRMRVYKKVNNFYKAVTNDMLLHLNFIDETRAKYEMLEINLVEDILEEGFLMNKFVVEDSHLAAIAIVTALRGLELPLFNNIDEHSFEARLDQLLNVLFMGIIKR
ncbi:MAG: TetR/AcrR family transcriptional regulator [Salinivirgaceae bacterium]|nr:TetR/AcrR family transcriptional regulator [Salinivirgaceae bacterium]